MAKVVDCAVLNGNFYLGMMCLFLFETISKLEIVFTIAAPAFEILFIGCVLNTKIVYITAVKLTFEAFY